MTSETLFLTSGITSTSPQIEQLKSLFPACFDKGGRFLWDKFQAEIAQQTDIGREFYSMNWLGKSYARLLRNLPPETLLAEDKTHNAKPENQSSQNLLIRGDNLEVLKHLQNAYMGSVKMIYIDPPYNTGSDGFVYQDDRKFTPAELARLANIDEDEAARILNFTDKGSNSHSAWLTFMYPRLYVARELLKDDGVIFISIDDNEAAQLKLLCDEVFGEGNFVADVIWNSRKSVSSDALISLNHNHILIYSMNNDIFYKNKHKFKLKLNLDGFDNPDNDSRGKWKADPFDSPGIRANLTYEIENPNTKERYLPPNGRCWRTGEKEYLKLLADNRIIFGKTGNSKPQLKRFLNEAEERGKTTKSIWDDVGTATNGTQEIQDLFGEKVFSTPKPTSLIRRAVELSCDNNDSIMDFFAGSGTTAHAVMQLNAEDGGSRRYICVQLPEKTDEKSEAYKAGYQTISDITQARIEKAAAKIRAEHPNYTGDLSFKIFQTVENFRQHQDDDFAPDQMNFPFNDKLSEEQLQTLLTTWVLYDGAALTTPIEPVQLGGYTAYLCEKRLYLMHAGFDSANLLAFIQKLDGEADFNPNRIIVFGGNMQSRMQQELDQAVRTYANKKDIELNLIVRV
ncbi:site-specific DNA-methyltransferase [Dentiradicibacter hellwigii]|uniref:site-specific DNA-methyltransferase (adenine-specific) n=1 Tax=Dentiradicibacter hellwigii TaxID=3149053 RepID=A0ABV4UFE0_9RHOO